MTTTDTKAIRAQMEALAGFTVGPWYTHNLPGDWGLGGAHSIHVACANPHEWDPCIAQVEYQTHYCLGEKPSVMEAARTAACNARLIAAAPDMRDTILTLCDEVDRLRTIIDNLHHVEQKHRDTANDQFHRANKLQAENERLRGEMQIANDGWHYADGCAELAMKHRDEAETEIERLRADREGRPPLTSDELAEFRRNHPLDGLARVALAAWVNVRPDQLPPAMQAHNCPATMAAWARVADAISRAMRNLGDDT